MHKEYQYEEDLIYYIYIKPVNSTEKMETLQISIHMIQLKEILKELEK